jgi:CBS domain-containing protein
MSEFDLPVVSYMVAPVRSIRDTARLAEAARSLDEWAVSALPVVDGGVRLTGVLDRLDLVRVGRLRKAPKDGEPRLWLPNLSVAECMQTAVPVASRTQSLSECARRMLDRGIHRIYIVTDRELEGVVSTREMLRAVSREQTALPLGAMALDVAACVDATEPVSVASARLVANAGRTLVVVNEAAVPVGVFSRKELQASLEADAGETTRLWMDDQVVVLPASMPACVAAERALASGARYLIASEGAASYRVISELAFAGCVCGQLPVSSAPTLTLDAPLAAVSVDAPAYAAEAVASGLGPLLSVPLPLGPEALERRATDSPVRSARPTERSEPPEPH